MRAQIAILTIVLGILLTELHAQDVDKYPYTELGRISARLDDLVYNRQDFDSALALCMNSYTVELSAYWAGKGAVEEDYVNKFENYAHLIENYSDYDRGPLGLYFRARGIEAELWEIVARGGLLEYSKSKEWVELYPHKLENYYWQLITEFPHCKLAAFACYLLAVQYDQFPDIYVLDRSDSYAQDYGPALRDTLSSLYQSIIRDYPESVFPTTERLPNGIYFSRRGIKIAPIAQWQFAQIWTKRGGPSSIYDVPRAIQEYRYLIDHFPDAIDTDSTLLAVKACWAQLDFYSNKYMYRDFNDFKKARTVCQRLLDDFPNVRISFPQEYASIETHPAAYLKLAEIESDIPMALDYYEKVIYGFPGSCKGGEDGPVDYAVVALNELVQNLNNAELSIAACRKVLESPLPVRIRASAQWCLANIYSDDLKDQDRAIQELQRVVDEFGDVATYYRGTYGEWATAAIRGLQRRINK